MWGSGAFWFGIVVGFVTYRTIHHKTQSGISDIAAIVGAVGGSAVIALFPTGTPSFDNYAFGLAIGFFFYLILSSAITLLYGGAEGSATKGAKAARAFLDDD